MGEAQVLVEDADGGRRVERLVHVRARGVPGDLGQQQPVGAAAEHGRRVDGGTVRGRQAEQPAPEHVGQALGHRGERPVDAPVLGQAEGLADEQRVAPGAFGEGRHGRRVAQAGQLRDRGGVEPGQRQAEGVVPPEQAERVVHRRRALAGPYGDHDRDRAAQQHRKVGQQAERRRVRPLEVVEQHEQRAVGGGRVEVRRGGLVQPEPGLARLGGPIAGRTEVAV